MIVIAVAVFSPLEFNDDWMLHSCITQTFYSPIHGLTHISLIFVQEDVNGCSIRVCVIRLHSPSFFFMLHFVISYSGRWGYMYLLFTNGHHWIQINPSKIYLNLCNCTTSTNNVISWLRYAYCGCYAIYSQQHTCRRKSVRRSNQLS